METSWESELAVLLHDLLAVQDELLAILGKKRDLLVAGNAQGLAAIGPQEERLIESLQQWVTRREQLLTRAGQDGLPTASLRALSGSLPTAQQKRLDATFKVAGSRARLLQHHSLTNWVIIQRTLIHLSQMLEIIATGGRLQPTYGEEASGAASGALVDQAA